MLRFRRVVRNKILRIYSSACMIFAALCFVFPFFWVILESSRTKPGEVFGYSIAAAVIWFFKSQVLLVLVDIEENTRKSIPSENG